MCLEKGAQSPPLKNWLIDVYSFTYRSISAPSKFIEKVQFISCFMFIIWITGSFDHWHNDLTLVFRDQVDHWLRHLIMSVRSWGRSGCCFPLVVRIQNTLVALREAALFNIRIILRYLQCHVARSMGLQHVFPLGHPESTLCFTLSQLLASVYCHRRQIVIIIV